MSILIYVGLFSILATAAFTWWAATEKAEEGGQTVLESIKEAWTNIAVGFTINYIANIVILPMAGFEIGLGSAFWVGCIFTGISIVRQFVIRRYFNKRMVKRELPPTPIKTIVLRRAIPLKVIDDLVRPGRVMTEPE